MTHLVPPRAAPLLQGTRTSLAAMSTECEAHMKRLDREVEDAMRRLDDVRFGGMGHLSKQKEQLLAFERTTRVRRSQCGCVRACICVCVRRVTLCVRVTLCHV